MSRLGRVAVVGAGQIGTMVGARLRSSRRGEEVGVFDIDPGAVRACLEKGGADLVIEREEAALEAQVVVLALPVLEIIAWLRRLGPRAHPGTLVIDTGSAKRQVVEAMAELLPEGVHAVGGHPMVGNERSGASAAEPESLTGAPFLLVPARSDGRALELARELVGELGAEATVIDPEIHDRLIARTSHLPHLVAAGLARVALADPEEPALAHLLSGSGLRSSTRLAGSDPGMVAEFLVANRDQVEAALDELRAELRRLRRGLAAGPGPLAQELARARADRASLPAAR